MGNWSRSPLKTRIIKWQKRKSERNWLELVVVQFAFQNFAIPRAFGVRISGYETHLAPSTCQANHADRLVAREKRRGCLPWNLHRKRKAVSGQTIFRGKRECRALVLHLHSVHQPSLLPIAHNSTFCASAVLLRPHFYPHAPRRDATRRSCGLADKLQPVFYRLVDLRR